MSRAGLLKFLEVETKHLRQAGLVRPELELASPPPPLQGAVIRVGEQDLVSYASSDYLGLSVHPALKKAACAAIEAWGVGLASPRAAVGTIGLHGELEKAVAALVGAEDALVFASGHHVDTAIFEALLGDRDYVFADEMVRPSVADGIRLSRARAYSYRNGDMQHLEDRLKRSRAARFRVIATDSVFPTTGRVTPLEDLYALAAKYHAVVVVDDTQGLGVLGAHGAGAHAALGGRRPIDLVTGSFGAALGGGAGGFVAGRKTILDWLRQKARTHLSSTSLAPAGAGAALEAIRILRAEPHHRATLDARLETFKEAMAKDAGLLIDVSHPAISVVIRNAILAQKLTDMLVRQSIFVVGYCHPVVPEGDARICLRVTARHSDEQVRAAARAIGEGMKTLKIQL